MKNEKKNLIFDWHLWILVFPLTYIFHCFRYGYGYPSYYSPDDNDDDDNTQSYGDWDEEYEDYVEIDEDYDVSYDRNQLLLRVAIFINHW